MKLRNRIFSSGSHACKSVLCYSNHPTPFGEGSKESSGVDTKETLGVSELVKIAHGVTPILCLNLQQCEVRAVARTLGGHQQASCEGMLQWAPLDKHTQALCKFPRPLGICLLELWWLIYLQKGLAYNGCEWSVLCLSRTFTGNGHLMCVCIFLSLLLEMLFIS